MDKEKNEKNVSIFTPILWMFTTVVWAVAVYRNISTGGTPRYLIALQCCTVIVSCVAAIINFIRYKRSRSSKSK